MLIPSLVRVEISDIGAASSEVTLQALLTELQLKANPNEAQLVTATSWPLPTGAATSSKQPAFSLPGVASSDLVSIQGNTSMIPVRVTTPTGSPIQVIAPVNNPTSVRLSDGTNNISTLPVSIAVLPSLSAGLNTIGTVNIGNSNAIATTAKQDELFTLVTNLSNKIPNQSSGRLPVSVTTALPTGNNTIGSVTQAGTWSIIGPITNTQLRATPINVDIASSVPLDINALELQPSTNIIGRVGQDGTWTVLGPLTNTELRATPIPVAGPLTNTELRATPVPVTGTLTDTQLRATAVNVSVSSLPVTSANSTLQRIEPVSLITISTNFTGTTLVQLPNLTARILEIYNDTGTELVYSRGSSGPLMTIEVGGPRKVYLAANANEIYIKRKDDSNISVSFTVEVLK